jgi:hypothetical protein
VEPAAQGEEEVNPIPAFDALRSPVNAWPVRIEDAADRLGVALGYVGVAIMTPFVIVLWLTSCAVVGWKWVRG